MDICTYTRQAGQPLEGDCTARFNTLVVVGRATLACAYYFNGCSQPATFLFWAIIGLT